MARPSLYLVVSDISRDSMIRNHPDRSFVLWVWREWSVDPHRQTLCRGGNGIYWSVLGSFVTLRYLARCFQLASSDAVYQILLCSNVSRILFLFLYQFLASSTSPPILAVLLIFRFIHLHRIIQYAC